MNAFVYKAREKRGGFVQFTPPVANRSQQTRFGVADTITAAILAALALGAAAAFRFLLGS
jgi:hypothetical protein